MDELITAKMELFDDFDIPWSNQIEMEYLAYKKANGAERAEIFLDNLCQSYIVYSLDHYAEVVYEAVKAKHPKTETLYEDVIKKEVGKYAFGELIKANLIELCGSFKGRKLYAI